MLSNIVDCIEYTDQNYCHSINFGQRTGTATRQSSYHRLIVIIY